MNGNPEHFMRIYNAPILMTVSERVALYSLVFGRRPQHCLEIGTHRGGSSVIIVGALDDIGAGRLSCVDPNPLISPEHWRLIEHRTALFSGFSPAILPEAMEAAGGPIDFALIDGDHEYPGVVRDIEGVLPLLADDAYVVFHDAHYWQVSDAIDHMVQKYADQLTDCGFVSVEKTQENRVEQGRQVVWGGLRLLRYRSK